MCAKFVPKRSHAATVDGDGPPQQSRAPPRDPRPVKDAAPAAGQGRQGLWTGGTSTRGGGPGGLNGAFNNAPQRDADGEDHAQQAPREPFWGGAASRAGSGATPAAPGHGRFDTLQHGGVSKHNARREEDKGGKPAAVQQPAGGGARGGGGGQGKGRHEGRPYNAAFSSLAPKEKEKEGAEGGGDRAAAGDREPRPRPSSLPHALACEWTMHIRRRPEKGQDEAAYAKLMKRIADFSTVEGFWATYSHLMHPDQVPVNNEYMMFRKGVLPLWEDPTNINGGKFLVRLPKGQATDLWEDLLLHVVGGQFHPSDEVLGCVVSVRPKEDVVSVWTRDAGAEGAVRELERQLRQLADTRKVSQLEYRAHRAQQDQGGTPQTPESAPLSQEFA